MDILDLHFKLEQACDPNLIQRKRSKMAAKLLDFFRGSPAIFYAMWSQQNLGRAPVGWICGDAHWENVGSYKGKNHVAYFDFTDFDHACMAPLDYDLGRATTCLYILGLGNLAAPFLSAYRTDLCEGKPYHIESEVAQGTVATLLDAVANRSQRKFIRRMTENGHLFIDKEDTFALGASEKREVSAVFKRWAATMKNPAFFNLEDICRSCTGLGILGYRRYVVLVSGKNAPHILDIKEGVASAAARFAGIVQPAWSSEAERIAEVQRMLQYVPISRLGWTKGNGTSFVISEYQPSEDRVSSLKLSEGEYMNFTRQWGKLLAWSHLRGGGWKGSATTSDLISFASAFDSKQQRALLHKSKAVADRFQRLFESFRRIVGQDTD